MGVKTILFMFVIFRSRGMTWVRVWISPPPCRLWGEQSPWIEEPLSQSWQWVLNPPLAFVECPYQDPVFIFTASFVTGTQVTMNINTWLTCTVVILVEEMTSQGPDTPAKSNIISMESLWSVDLFTSNKATHWMDCGFQLWWNLTHKFVQWTKSKLSEQPS